MKTYKLPFLSRVACLILPFIPVRIHALIHINAYDVLDQHYRDVEEVDGDTRTLLSSVSAVQIENLRRKLWYNHVKATTESEREKK